MDGWKEGKVVGKKGKKGPNLSCVVHQIGANLYSKLLVAPFSCKKVWHWVDGRMEGSKSRVKDCLQQSKKDHGYAVLIQILYGP